MQWAEGTGFLTGIPNDRSQHTGLSTPDLQRQLERILTAIRLLLTDSHNLELKYGLRSNHVMSVRAIGDETLAVSSARARTFEVAFARFRDGILHRQKDASFGAKLKWVIKDRDIFGNLLRNLHQLISSLIEPVALPRYFQRLLVKEDIDALPNDVSHLRLVQAASQGQDDEWSEFASLRVEASQQATQDFRTLEEWLDDVHSVDEDSTSSQFSSFEDDVESKMPERFDSDQIQNPGSFKTCRKYSNSSPRNPFGHDRLPFYLLPIPESSTWYQSLTAQHIKGKSMDFHERLAWISCMQIPGHSWSYESFAQIMQCNIQTILELLVETLQLLQRASLDGLRVKLLQSSRPHLDEVILRALKKRLANIEGYCYVSDFQESGYLRDIRGLTNKGYVLFTVDTDRFCLIVRKLPLSTECTFLDPQGTSRTNYAKEEANIFAFNIRWHHYGTEDSIRVEQEVRLIEGHCSWSAIARTNRGWKEVS